MRTALEAAGPPRVGSAPPEGLPMAIVASPPPEALPMPTKLLLRQPPPPLPEDALVAAVAADDANAFARALPAGCEMPERLVPHGRAARNWTWLHAATAQGAPAIVQLLLSPGVLPLCALPHIDRRAGDGRTPLLIAAEHRHAGTGRDCAALAALLRAGAAATAPRKPDGATAAHLCCEAGCARCLQLLLQRAPNLVDAACRRSGEHPLHAAARCGSTECVGVLCSLGARLDAPATATRHEPTPLHLACTHAASRQTVRLLLERRARVDIRDGGGRTPLHRASTAGSSRAIAELLAAGADPDCFGVAVESALRALREAAQIRGVPAPRSPTSRVVGRYARLLCALARGGAIVRSDDLVVLRLGWNESRGTAQQAKQHAAASRVASLREICQRALANGLTAENVLPTLHVATLVEARRLRSECERLVLQNAAALAEMGAFAAFGGSARVVLRRLISNVLQRHAALEMARANATFFEDSARSSAELGAFADQIWARAEESADEEELFQPARHNGAERSSSPSSSSESESASSEDGG